LTRRLVVATVIAVLVLAVVATPASAKTVTPEEWAPKFCSALSNWQDKLTTDGDAAEAALSGKVSNLKQAKSQLVSFLGKSVTNTKNAVSAIQNAGTPNSENGDKIEAAFVSGLQSAAALFQSAKAKAQTASTKNLASFEKVTTQVTSALNKGGDAIDKSFSKIETLDTNGTLGAAIEADPSCAFLTSGSTTTTTSP
jgi:hypothetical protein